MPTGFSDADSSPYAEAIGDLHRLGIVGGKADGIFRPTDPLFRAQFAKMMVNACELLVFEGVGSRIFPDVPDDPASLYPDDFVAQAAAEGLIKGYRNGLFRPYTDREELSLEIKGARSAGAGLAPADLANSIMIAAGGSLAVGGEVRQPVAHTAHCLDEVFAQLAP